MQSIRFLYLPAVIAAVAAVIALGVSAPVHGAQPVTTSLQVPLDGTVFVPLSNGDSDAVPLTGFVHVVTHVPIPGGPIRIHVNLDQVGGVGDLTGLLYVATGANRINLPTIPGDPMNLGFELHAVGSPPNPITPPTR